MGNAPDRLQYRILGGIIDMTCLYRVRFPDDFSTYILSSQTPLLTFWTASYCSTCQAIRPLLQELIESGVGEDEGGVSFCEVEYDSQDIMNSGLGMTYTITSMPTLLSFDRGIPRADSRVTDAAKIKNKDWLAEWIRNEARNNGSGGDGGILGKSGLLGGWFGNTK